MTQTAAVAVPRKAFSASNWQMHAWGIGSIASYFMYEQFYLIQNIHTTTFKVNPTLVGAILAMPRLVDGLLDPLIGHWSDNMRGRFGRRRPFLLVSGLIGALLASAIFWMSPEWGQWIKGVILAFAAISLFTACGTYDMAFKAMGYELSDDYADRSRVQAIKGVYWGAMGVVGGYVIGLATNPRGTGDDIFGDLQGLSSFLEVCWKWWTGSLESPEWTPYIWNWWESSRHYVHNFSSEAQGFRVVSAIISAMIFVTLFFPVLFCKERFVKINRTHVDLWKAIKETLHCRPFVIILIINVTRGAGTLSRQLFFYVGVYYVCAGNKAMYTNAMAGKFAFWGFLFSLVVWPLARPITKLIGKRFSFIATAGLGLAQSIAIPFVARPGHLSDWFMLNALFLPVSMIVGASANGIMPDICDLDELQHGERREGMFGAVEAFFNKMEISVMMLLTGVFLSWTGFIAGQDIQPDDVLTRMRWMAFAPLILISFAAFILSFFMPITEKMMKRVRAELDARHAAAGIVTAPPAKG